MKITPCYDEGAVKVKVFTTGGQEVPCKGEISLKGEVVKEVDFKANRTVKIFLKDFASWTPETPNLYDMRITMGEDQVETYFGMRKYSVEKDGNGILRFMLNNRPYIHNGLLDQGYFPDGLYTAPSDEALQYDIIKMKELGFNLLRKHIKVEPARWYYHCDRIGDVYKRQTVINTIFNYAGSLNTWWQNVVMGALVLISIGVQSEVFRSHKKKRKGEEAC